MRCRLSYLFKVEIEAWPTEFLVTHSLTRLYNEHIYLGWLKGSAMLLCLFGTTWSFGFLSAVDILQPFVSIIFSVLNSLQARI